MNITPVLLGFVVGTALNTPLGIAASFTYAGKPADGEHYYPIPVPSNPPTSSRIVGSEFVYLGETARISRLGIWDSDADGLVHSHEVGIWELTSTDPDLVASVLLQAGSGSDASGYAWAAVSGAAYLESGHRYVLGALYPVYNSAGAYDFYTVIYPYDSPINAAFQWVSERYLNIVDDAVDLTFPTQTDATNSDPRWFGPNVELLPEPGNYGLLAGLGLALFAGCRRCRKATV